MIEVGRRRKVCRRELEAREVRAVEVALTAVAALPDVLASGGILCSACVGFCGGRRRERGEAARRTASLALLPRRSNSKAALLPRLADQ